MEKKISAVVIVNKKNLQSCKQKLSAVVMIKKKRIKNPELEKKDQMKKEPCDK